MLLKIVGAQYQQLWGISLENFKRILTEIWPVHYHDMVLKDEWMDNMSMASVECIDIISN